MRLKAGPNTLALSRRSWTFHSGRPHRGRLVAEITSWGMPTCSAAIGANLTEPTANARVAS